MIVDLGTRKDVHNNEVLSACARTQNCLIERVSLGDGAKYKVMLAAEAMLILVAGDVLANCPDYEHRLKERSVAVVPATALHLQARAPSELILIQSPVPDAGPNLPLNAASYTVRDERVVHSDPNEETPDRPIRVYEMDKVEALAGGGRLKMLQSSRISINWAEYEGPRDKRRLSPHNHDNLEQASVALEGSFVVHSRTPWTADSTMWQEDRHEDLHPGQVAIFPVGVIHTVEGIGSGRHLLIDVFSPPRQDFIEKGFVSNSEEYS